MGHVYYFFTRPLRAHDSFIVLSCGAACYATHATACGDIHRLYVGNHVNNGTVGILWYCIFKNCFFRKIPAFARGHFAHSVWGRYGFFRMVGILFGVMYLRTFFTKYLQAFSWRRFLLKYIPSKSTPCLCGHLRILQYAFSITISLSAGRRSAPCH